MERDKLAARAAFSKLTLPEKIAHFWYYYKWHFFGTLFVLFLLTLFIHERATQVNSDLTILNVTHPQSFVEREAVRSAEEYLAEYVDDTTGNGRAVVSIQTSSFIIPDIDDDDTMNEVNIMSMQGLQLQLAEASATMFIVDDVFLEFFKQNYERIIEQYAPITNSRVLEMLQINDEFPLYAIVRIIYPREREGRGAEQRLAEHSNVRDVFELLTEYSHGN